METLTLRRHVLGFKAARATTPLKCHSLDLQQSDAPSHAHDDDAEETTTQWGCHRETIMVQNGNEQSLLFTATNNLFSSLLFSSLLWLRLGP
jgi:hypothetical protein